MLMSNEFVKPMDKYRRNLLRDQYQSESTGRAGKVVGALVVTGALLLLAACGPLSDTNLDAGPNVAAEATTDQGSADDVTVVPAPDIETPEEKFSGVPAPDWHPAYGRIPMDEQAERTSGPR